VKKINSMSFKARYSFSSASPSYIIVNGYKLDNHSMIPGTGRDIFLPAHPDWCCGLLSLLYSGYPGTISLGIKWPEYEAVHSLPSSG
jgi:hypothetical protein